MNASEAMEIGWIIYQAMNIQEGLDYEYNFWRKLNEF